MSLRTFVLILAISSFQIDAYDESNCKRYLTTKNFQLIIDYARWRNIKHVAILEENIKLGCNFKAFKRSLRNFSKNKMYISLLSTINLNGQAEDVRHKKIIITFYKNHSRENFIEQANNLTMNGDTISWLIIMITQQTYILDHLRYANFSLDADVVIAVDTKWTRTEPYSQISNHNSNNISACCAELRKSDKDANNFTPFLNNNNLSSPNLTNFCQNGSMMSNDSYCMLQIYKIRSMCNNSLVVYPLGFWNYISGGTERLKKFLNTEERGNLFGFPLIFGYKNSTQRTSNENMVDEDDENDDTNMFEFMSYFSLILNSSKTITAFPKIGTKDNNGKWTDLIGAIINEEVDLGVDSIVSTPERGNDMTFTYNIMKSVRNIYIQPQVSNDVRDIFLTPFDSRLIFCVVGVITILAIVMTIYSKIIAKVKDIEASNKGNGFLDSVIWCIGIFSQQGSIWTPRSCSEKIIVIVSLSFTLLIYNSYSAFITSVLSIKRWDIRTVEDLLNSNYEIGYTKNSQDELYLRSMNITQLNEIYLRGYLHNNINNVSEGLLKAAKGNYAFFASGHVARNELLVISNYRCIYDIAEIPVPYSVNYIAFPMSKRSPYKRLINLSIIRMYESGIYKYIYPLMDPKLQICEELMTYQSAGLPDLMAAFGILFIGTILSIAIVIGECMCKRRRKIYASLRKNIFHGRPTLKAY